MAPPQLRLLPRANHQSPAGGLLLCAVAAVLARSRGALAAAAAPAAKAPKPLKREMEKALRLEAACDGCFPRGREECGGTEQWSRCCAQEIACHNYHCREEVLGQLQANTKVRARTAFLSDDEARAEIAKGTKGRVVRTDSEGDALIKFFDEYDEEIVRHWVFKQTFWEKLELPERPERMRASKVTTCMDNCTLAMNCNMGELSRTKKGQKQIQACMKDCKFQECQNEKDCKVHADAYAACKRETAESQICSPLGETKEAEL